MNTRDILQENQTYLLSLYQAPFRYDRRGGYIWDANSKMVADNYDPDDAIDLSQNIEPTLRIRGWGYIQYLKHDQLSPAQIQDALGEMMAQALTEYWQRKQPPSQQNNDARRDVFYPMDARIIHGDY